MNQITQLFENISDEELRQGVLEIQNDSKTGIICDGVVRKYARLMSEIIGHCYSTDLMTSEINILKMAAYRWVK